MGAYCKVFNEDALWFIGSGIAIILAGLFNMLVCMNEGRTVQIVTVIVNVFITGLFVAAMQVLHGPQVYIGITLFLLAAVLTMLRMRARHANQR